ncbi:MAG TPA: glycogen synthase GlgA [Bacteroidales bacterium]|nr:glycogen synthase GlgA [Bacteroidales bacterium]
MRILMVSAECAPFSKSGGLGDVVGALPSFLNKNGAEVIVVTPLYSFIDRKKFSIEPLRGNLNVLVGNDLLSCRIHQSKLQGDVPVYFIEYEPYFERPGMYHDAHFNDYSDNPKRFAFLSKAALNLCHQLDFSPDIVHANDWHTAMTPAFLKIFFGNDPLFKGTASVLTIHNIAYQGRYNSYYYFSTGMGWEDFTQDKFEHFGDVNFLKGGIHYADVVNTVSKGYADETRIPPGGYGLEYFLIKKGDDFAGILNGADYSHWNPETDRLIPANYSKEDLKGKAVCKEVLQKQMGLVPDPGIPLIGIVSRLVEQKGFHIVAQCINELIDNEDVQFAILGSGDRNLENFFRGLGDIYPGWVGTYIGFDNELAHLIEAGSDMFLMPSLYEPCGLNQIYSLKYGTLPIVRATGGLDDTVENYDPETGEGTGFKFHDPDCTAVSNTIMWALDTYYNNREHFGKMVQSAMSRHFSWDDSAGEYMKLYEKALSKVRQGNAAAAKP